MSLSRTMGKYLYDLFFFTQTAETMKATKGKTKGKDKKQSEAEVRLGNCKFHCSWHITNWQL